MPERTTVSPETTVFGPWGVLAHSKPGLDVRRGPQRVAVEAETAMQGVEYIARGRLLPNDDVGQAPWAYLSYTVCMNPEFSLR